MLFNSLQFLAFFPIVTLLYYATPSRWRWLPLLVSSCYFYMAFVPRYIWILGVTIVVDYAAGLLIARSSGRRRKAWLIVSIVANVGFLAYFKYFGFIVENLKVATHAVALDWRYPTLNIILPIGLSFHIFQSLSYTIEVYRGKQAPERHFGIYALYVMFYPQLVAGPIERPQNLLHQFHAEHPFAVHSLIRGIQRMVWGLYKKVVIADRLSPMVSRVYDHVQGQHGLPLVLATLAFTLQIYCDFSGYSDIAIGAAEVMGIQLMENFRCPYSASSISEFWTRWHISLSRWFRDYVYVPLGGNRHGEPKQLRNLLIVFLLSGLWHGARWTFVVWGALHALYVVVERLIHGGLHSSRHVSGKMRAFFSNALVVGLVAFAWIFFRATSFVDGWYIATHLLGGLGHQLVSRAGLVEAVAVVSPSRREAAVAIAAVLVMRWVERQDERSDFRAKLAALPMWQRWPIYYTALFAVILLGVFTNDSFIYFQF